MNFTSHTSWDEAEPEKGNWRNIADIVMESITLIDRLMSKSTLPKRPNLRRLTNEAMEATTMKTAKVAKSYRIDDGKFIAKAGIEV